MAHAWKRATVGASLLGVLLGGAAWLGWPGEAAPVAPGAVGAAAPGFFVPSMEGTERDGSLGQSGGTLPYAELRRMFDYYLSAVGEKSIAEITLEIQRVIDKEIPATKAAAAKRLLTQYLDYKRALVELEKDPKLAGAGLQAIRQRFTRMQDARARFFSAEEEHGLFAFEDAYDRDALARLEVDQNPALSASQKREQLAAMDAAMSPALRADRDAPRMVLKLEEKAQAMRAAGASDDDIYRMRAKALDPQAASRLAEVDREEKAWKERIALYLNERSKLLTSNKPEADKQLALAQLQQAQFTEEERLRLPAYEQ
jgi:lipase chaperone LimK